MSPAAASLSGVVLFLVPGLFLLALLPRETQESLESFEAAFLVVASSVMTSAWLGLVLAEAGLFSLVRAALILVVGTFFLTAVFFSRLGFFVPRPRFRSFAPPLALLALCFALDARPSENLLGGRDPGAYVAAMCLIGRTGGIVYKDPAVLSIPEGDRVLFFRNPKVPTDYSWARFMGFPLERPETGLVVPAFFHLFPVFGAYLFEAMGVKGALATPPLFAILGTLAVFLALRRILGFPVAFLGTLLFATNEVAVWFSRYPVSETLSLFLIFTGLFALAIAEETSPRILGFVAGISFGLSLLVRIDGVLLLAPLVLYAWLRREEKGAVVKSLLVSIGILLAHAAIHTAFWSRKYFIDILNRPYWRHSRAFWLVVAASLLLILPLQRLVRRMTLRGESVRRWIAAGLAVAALYAFFLRPRLSAWAGADGNDPATALVPPRGLVVQRVSEPTKSLDPLHHTRPRADSKAFLASLPPFPRLLVRLGFRRLAAHDAQAFYRLSWFVTPLGLLLSVVGLLLLIRQGRPEHLPLILVGLSFSLFYLYKIRVYNDYYFALRRFVPATLPLLFACTGYLLVRIASRFRVIAGVLALFLFASNARALLAGASEKKDLLRFVDWKSSVSFISDLSHRFGPNDIVIFEQPRSIHLLSLPLWAAHDIKILQLARFDPDPVRLTHVVRTFRERYENVYFVHTYSTDLCGLFLDRVQDVAFGTYEWERTYDRPPRAPEARSFHFTVSRVVLPEEVRVPPLREIDVGASDDELVSGFFNKELDGERTIRWTGSCASLLLPGAEEGATVSITASANKRPEPAPVTASFGGVLLGKRTVGPGWEDLSFILPRPLPPGSPVLRLDIPAWRPAKTLAGSSDTRDLGIMVDRVTISGGKR